MTDSRKALRKAAKRTNSHKACLPHRDKLVLLQKIAMFAET